MRLAGPEVNLKPINSQENLQRCWCHSCALFNECNKAKQESLFCARQKSECAMDATQSCLCPSCPVYMENNLTGSYFCVVAFEG